MNVLITGAAGYLAGFVIARLQPHHRLTLFDVVAPASPRSRPGRDRTIAGDIRVFEQVLKACAGQDVVVHLVALVRERFDKPHDRFADIMVKGTWNVAEACAKLGVSKLVNVSSVVAAGSPRATDRAYRVGEPARFRAADLYYSLAKHLGERIGAAYHDAHGLRVINIRPGMIAGDGLNADPARPWDAAARWFTHVHPKDAAQAVALAVENQDVEHGTFQVVAGRDDGVFDWTDAVDGLGYRPLHNWPRL